MSITIRGGTQAINFGGVMVMVGSLPAGASWAQVASTSSNHAILSSTGALYVWGRGALGTMGDGTTVAKSSPVQISGSWSFISGGANHFAAIRSDGSLWCWGANALGQLGDGTTVNRSSPVQAASGSWVATGCTGEVTWALKSNGTLWGTGTNVDGEIPDWPALNGGYSNLVQIGTDTDWSRSIMYTIESYVPYGSALKTDGSLWQWGTQYGTLVVDQTQDDIDTGFVVVPRKAPGTTSWAAIAATAYNMAAIHSDGTLWAWGSVAQTSIAAGNGDGTTVDRSSPVQISASSWTAIASGYEAFIAIRSDGTLWAWGYNVNGALGNSSTVQITPLTQVSTSSWRQISMGRSCIGIKSDGTVWTWGLGLVGQLGDGTTIARSSPVQLLSLIHI